jgi:predicted dehydrogenase
MVLTRRGFITGLAASARCLGANDRVVLACMGVRGRGGTLMRDFASTPGFEVAIVCDVDTRLFEKAVADVERRQHKHPRTISDFRRALDDPSIDALVIGTPDHWHAIPSILACQAGKHVYVEKPAGHNLREGRAMIEAAHKHKRVMQVGIQSRSGRHFAEACEYIKSGALGKVTLAKAWESARQKPVPPVPDSGPPAGVDYDMWLGPAPLRPFNPNRFHSNWRWFFDYGTGDLGNDGVHRIDYARRGLEAAFAARGQKLPEWPAAVSSSGGKLYFDDVQEWPDTLNVTWEYPGALLVYEMRVWSSNPIEEEEEGAAIYGDNGYVVIGNVRWRAFDTKGKLVRSGASDNEEHDRAHKQNFLDAIRGGAKLTCDAATGHVASGYSHLGNIAWRVNRKLRFDPASERFAGDEEANKLLGRTYRKPWTLS